MINIDKFFQLSSVKNGIIGKQKQKLFLTHIVLYVLTD